MNRNKIILYIAIIALALAIAIPTFCNISNQRQEKLYKSMTLKVIEASKKCVNDKKCNSNKIFVKDLIDNKYISNIINPHTNKNLDENSFVRIQNNNYELIVVE